MAKNATKIVDGAAGVALAEETAEILRLPTEQIFADQLEALRQNDADKPPASWRMSPRAVLAYIIGGKTLDAEIGGKKQKVEISRKFYGDTAIVERAIVTLASDRALLLVGDPGTGKSWLSEHLAAAICGNSSLAIQGTAGTTEEHIKYSWNIARVIAEGPNPGNLIPSPTMVAMRTGGLLRFEEITRCVPDVQDALVSILSDKNISIPELPDANVVFARPGFNVIATANSRDQGVNDLSAALKRRFNYVHIPIVSDKATEVEIVRQRSADLLARYDMPVMLEPSILDLLATAFRELRDGKTSDGISVKSPGTTLLTAEAIGTAVDATLHARFFGDGKVTAASIARNLIGSIVKEDAQDLAALKEYVAIVAKKRGATDKTWAAFHEEATKGAAVIMPADPTSSSQISATMAAAAIDVGKLTARVDALLAEPMYWFPVRHHSPAVARRVGEAIRDRRPRIVFIEGPHEAQGMIEYLMDAGTRPPVAIYSSFRDDKVAAELALTNPLAPAPRHSAWYPLVTYSPEWVAMSSARATGAEAVFMDLPHYAIGTDGEAPDPAQPGIGMPPAAQGPVAGPPRPRDQRRDLEEIASRSDFYRLLSKAAGHRSFGETWDRLFETPRQGQGHEQFRRETAVFCAAVRATTPRDALERDGTLPRERFMWRTIQETLASREIDPKDAMVVCGGFHIFMDRADPLPPPPIPEGTLSVTVAPYSYFRISELSGYGAGNRAPRFYELCFQHHGAGRGQDHVVMEYVIDVLKEARRHGEPLSSADAIAATQHALMLARLRGNRDPVLDDIRDALITCCCKGNPKHDATRLMEAMDEVNIGTRLGRVTERIGRLPIVSDFYDQLARHQFEEVAAREKVFTYVLDKRQPAEAARSAFLHRLVFLGVEIGGVQRETAAFGQSIFREHWRLKWSPKIEAALMERNLHGDTIETAATTLLRESLGVHAGEAGPACRRLVQAVDMDLPQLVAHAEQNTGHAIDHDERFHSLADALTSLMLLERYAAYRGLGKQRLAGLIARCFDRACCRIPDVASVPPEEWDSVIQGLQAVAEPVVQRDDLDADLFAAHVNTAAKQSTVPFLRGAFLGVLTEMRRIKAEVIAAELVAYARGSVDQQVQAGDFLHGVLRVSRTAIMLGAKSLVLAVDELLKAASAETFLSMVPRLRAAFETLHERQKDSVALHVAELYGLRESESLRAMSTSVAGAQLMAALDARAAKIMTEWLES